jgi:hypothetical protein
MKGFDRVCLPLPGNDDDDDDDDKTLQYTKENIS